MPNLQFLISDDGLIGRENGSLGNVLTNSTGTTIDTAAPVRREISVSKIQLNDRTLWGTSLDAVLSLDSGRPLKSQRSDAHTSELQSLTRTPPAVSCLKTQDNTRSDTPTGADN